MGFLNSILGFFGDIGADIAAGLAYLFNLIIAVFEFVWNGLLIVAQFMLSAFKVVATFLTHLWDNFFKKIFVSAFNALRTLSTWLETHLRPLINWLKQAQRYILNIYTRYVRPIVVAIQRVRQVLAILRALHIGFAAKLDAVLGKIQSDINGVFLKINGTINAIIDVLNIVTDPARLLRHPLLILSVRRSVLALVRQLTGLPPGYWIPSRAPGAAPGTKVTPKNFSASNPLQNPPSSFYMSLDSPVPSLGFLASGEELPDTIADDVAPLDYFNADYNDIPHCVDGGLCFLQAVSDSRVRVVNG